MYVVCISFFFFFSSRRRHTRLVSDWSSDVCSSDLPLNPGFALVARLVEDETGVERAPRFGPVRPALVEVTPGIEEIGPESRALDRLEIGRASCRERV